MWLTESKHRRPPTRKKRRERGRYGMACTGTRLQDIVVGRGASSAPPPPPPPPSRRNRCVNLLISAYYVLFGASHLVATQPLSSQASIHLSIRWTYCCWGIAWHSRRRRSWLTRWLSFTCTEMLNNEHRADSSTNTRQEQGLTTSTTSRWNARCQIEAEDKLSGTRDSHQRYTHIINNIFIICSTPSSSRHDIGGWCAFDAFIMNPHQSIGVSSSSTVGLSFPRGFIHLMGGIGQWHLICLLIIRWFAYEFIGL